MDRARPVVYSPSDGISTVRDRIARGMDRGVLAFPLTAFGLDGSVDLDGYRMHIKSQLAAEPGALFPLCGTGEYYSVDETEYEDLVGVAVDEAAGGVPVVAGVGHGWSQAVRYVRAAERAGVDALLLMPPCALEGSQQGFVSHVREVVARTTLPVIVYHRAQMRFTTEGVEALADIPNIIGLKDGHADLDMVQRFRLAAPDHWLFFNGTATAEMQAGAYRGVGVLSYSSAVHAFAPEIARAFFVAFRRDDEQMVKRLLVDFYLPFVELRDQGPGYSVSLVKAAARMRGAMVGSVRAPLIDPYPEHVNRLRELLDVGLHLLES